jgi:hypothetical protein
MEELSEGQLSKFNAGILQMTRLHKLQEQLNEANYNPLAYNEALGVYNYEIIIRATTNIIKEAGKKLSDTEKKDALALKKVLEAAIEKYPIHELKINQGYPHKRFIQVNSINWKLLKEFIFQYEDLARGFLDKHNLNSPPEDESDLF